MGVFAQDTARNNLATWTVRGVKGGYLDGAVLSPFASPPEANGHKRSAESCAKAVRDAGGTFAFDPMTHALSMPRAGDFRHYDHWNLWSGPRGDLSTHDLRVDHIKRVFAAQRSLGSDLIAPTVLVSYPDSPKSQLALDLAQEARAESENCWLTIAGDAEFWQSGSGLDAHIGALDQLEPAGWMLVVVRGDNAMPPGATPAEVFGVMRTTYALAQDRPVKIAHGDVAGLPAVAAGAVALGSGWDMRQRICAYQDFEEREASEDGGGGWYQRPTLQGLVGSLAAREYAILQSEDRARSDRLTPGDIGSRPEDAFRHHASALSAIAAHLVAASTDRERCERLRAIYLSARREWSVVEQITGTRLGASRWIDPFDAGVAAFMSAEGWV